MLTVQYAQLFVRDGGPKEAPVLLVLHGGPGGNHMGVHNAMEEEEDLFFGTLTAFLSGSELPVRAYRLREEVP